MRHSRLKRSVVAFALTILPLVVSISFASDLGNYLDELVFTELQIAAVTTHMYMYLGWLPDKKEWMKETSEKAISDLNEIRRRITELKLPEQLSELKESNLEIIDKLKAIYIGVEEKEAEDIKQGFISCGELNSQYSEKLRDALKKYRHMQELPEDFEPVNEEIKLIQNQEDKDIYLNAIKLIRNKEYRQAYQDLIRLSEKYQDTVFLGPIKLRVSDCLLMADSDIKFDEGTKAMEDGLRLLSDIINKGEYSPILYEAFYKWRTTDQYFNHGMSNTSDIPNKEYNKRRWELIQIIKKYLKGNPADLWAQEQIDLLLSLPNITRGGTMGNNNLVHWGSLYVDLSKFQEKQEK